MSLLLDLTLRGSTAFVLLVLLNWATRPWLQARSRRWWWIVMPLAFLVIWRVPLLPTFAAPAALAAPLSLSWPSANLSAIPNEAAVNPVDYLLLLWIAGSIGSLILLIARSVGTASRWAREPLSVDTRLLTILEQAKATAGVTAPIGLVCSTRCESPALAGWLRPRILLPASLPSSIPDSRLRLILLHELAHFRSLDIPIGWLFALVRCVHWFNPLAHLAAISWSRFREEAADESVLAWTGNAQAYGETLVSIAESTSTPVPFGSLGISENFHDLKTRIHMITQHHRRAPRRILSLVITGLLLGFGLLQAEEPDAKTAAVAAMETWLGEIDQGHYARSWKEAAPSFQDALTESKWVAALNSVRKPLGKLKSRKLGSALHQTEVPSPTGTVKGDFVIAQFESSFDNLLAAVETVTFELDNGVWKASGYYIKPTL